MKCVSKVKAVSGDYTSLCSVCSANEVAGNPLVTHLKSALCSQCKVVSSEKQSEKPLCGIHTRRGFTFRCSICSF